MAIYQEKNKNKITKDGRCWYYRCYYTDIYGNRKQKVSKMYFRKKDAEEAERDFFNKIKSNDYSDINIMFSKVYDEWLENKKTQIKSSTYYNRKRRDNKYILEFFCKYKLHSINFDTISNWKNNCILKLNISLEHKNRIISDLKEILNYARDNYNFDGRILGKLVKYKVESVQTIRDSETNFWTYDEFKKFISVVDDRFYYTLFNFLYFTGLRYGEMNALCWNDINLKNKTLRINKTLTLKVEEQIYLITAPKTKNSVRIIDIDDDLLNLLKEHKDREQNIYNFNDDMFVFGNVKYIPATTFKRVLEKYINISQVKRITPHGFRHSHVSFLIYIGCDSKDVAERIGDTVQMVEKTYYHMFPDKKSSTVKAINFFKNKR